MSIIYTVISKVDGTDVVNFCDYDSARGNYRNIIHQLLKNAKIPQSITYQYNQEYNFHILKDKNILYVCMAGSVFKTKLAYAFLEQIRKQFKSKYTVQQILNAKTYDMSAGFEDILKTQTYFNNSQSHDKKDLLMKEMSQLQDVMTENIEKVLEIEGKVELIVNRSIKYDSIADEIKKSASRMKKEAFWNRNKFRIAVGSIFTLVIIGFIFLL